ncbi:hypothetical protein EDB82DRAFT_250560 [Fusarium venenatum]|uniref:uncharacterized protein n=1 Tax=Fusarium venenatum TaxID=56646 RepID=UPI001DF619BF|nr:hypothetical protein EDB82DRAFT_250560 [Fusarium venenatum]
MPDNLGRPASRHGPCITALENVALPQSSRTRYHHRAPAKSSYTPASMGGTGSPNNKLLRNVAFKNNAPTPPKLREEYRIETLPRWPPTRGHNPNQAVGYPSSLQQSHLDYSWLCWTKKRWVYLATFTPHGKYVVDMQVSGRSRPKGIGHPAWGWGAVGLLTNRGEGKQKGSIVYNHQRKKNKKSLRCFVAATNSCAPGQMGASMRPWSRPQLVLHHFVRIMNKKKDLPTIHHCLTLGLLPFPPLSRMN